MLGLAPVEGLEVAALETMRHLHQRGAPARPHKVMQVASAPLLTVTSLVAVAVGLVPLAVQRRVPIRRLVLAVQVCLVPSQARQQLAQVAVVVGS